MPGIEAEACREVIGYVSADLRRILEPWDGHENECGKPDQLDEQDHRQGAAHADPAGCGSEHGDVVPHVERERQPD